MGNYIFIVVMVLLAGPNLWAQEETAESTTQVEEVKTENQPQEESSPSQQGVEKIEVTGSYIRRTDVEGPSPIIVIDREKIEKSGVNSVGAVLQQSTASAFGADSDRVNLKGLGSAKTLILINGQRAPAGGSSFGSGPVDTNFIPLAAVERIEILNDGASATYGSDALAGVVNIITRKDIDGIAFMNQYNMTTNNGGDVNRLSLAYGSQEANSNFMTSMQIGYNQGSRLSDLDFSGLVNDVDARRSTNYRDDANGFRPSPLCNQLDQSGLCVDYDQSRFRINDGYDVDWVTQYSRKVGADTEFYSTLTVGYGMSEQESPVLLQEPGVGLGINLTGAETPAAWNSLPGYSGGDTKVFHRFDDLVNTRRFEDYYAGLVTGLRGYWGNSDWEWDVTLNNQFNTSTTSEQNVGVFSATKANFSSGAYNPFDLSARDTTGMGVDTYNRNRFQVNWAEFKTNGELGSFLGFDWASAFGTSAAHFQYGDNRADIFIDGDAMGQSGAVGSAGRELYAVFAETSGLIGKDFEVQLSLRGDFYSDFGETVNPKFATRYQPTNWLTFRGSVGTGFQAPTLQDMNAALEGFFNNFQDPIRCAQLNDCDLKSTTASQATNPNLKEERSISANVGTVIQPTKNFSMSMDYWNVSVRDVIGSAFGQALRLEQDFGNAALSNYGIQIIREGGAADGEIQRIIYTLENLGTQEAQGTDIVAEYKMKTGLGDFTFTNQLVYMFHFYQSFIDVYGREDIVGRQGIPRWRNNFSIGYKKGNWRSLIMARSTADMLETGNISQNLESIPSPTQFDVNLGYDAGSTGNFQVGVINLGNIRPRFSASQAVDRTLFRRVETIYFTYRNDF